jgi:butyrate kinase
MEKKVFRIMVINPGSTHDEVAIYDGGEVVLKESIGYSVEDLKPFEEKNVTSQYEFRKNHIKKALAQKGIDLSTLDAVIGRGGLLHPIPGGVFKVDDAMKDDLMSAKYGDHPCNLGGILAHAVGRAFKKPAFIADSVVVDEMWPLSRYSGMPENPRKSIFHCLNQKRVARLAARKLNKEYNDCSLIIMHAGGGVTVGAHYMGRVVDVNNGLDGDGPFTPQRSGGVPAGGLARICFSGKYGLDEIKLKLSRRGGLRAYLGTSDLKVLDKYILGEPLPEHNNLDTQNVTPEMASEILEAMCYQISKEIGALAAALSGRVDAIVLTGGVMYDQFCVKWIKERIEWIAPIFIFPGGDELGALKDAAERVLNGEEEAMIYLPEGALALSK